MKGDENIVTDTLSRTSISTSTETLSNVNITGEQQNNSTVLQVKQDTLLYLQSQTIAFQWFNLLIWHWQRVIPVFLYSHRYAKNSSPIFTDYNILEDVQQQSW